METVFFAVVCGLLLLAISLIVYFRPRYEEAEAEEDVELKDLQLKVDNISDQLKTFRGDLKDDFRINREESSKLSKDNRDELNATLKDIQKDQKETLEKISSDNVQAFNKLTESLDKELEKLTKTLEDKFSDLISKAESNSKEAREETKTSFNDFQTGFAAKIKDFNEIQKEKFGQLDKKQKELIDSTEAKLDAIKSTLETKLTELTNQAKTDSKEQRDAFKTEINEFQQAINNVQKEKFEDLEKKQDLLVKGTETKLEQMRETVDEKLSKTLNERLGQSFETVGKQLEAVQLGLGEMKNLATDVGGLKKVLSNVKMRGSMGEVQLGMLLEQILAPDQYEANVKTKASSNDHVEFAIKLPGKDDNNGQVWLPIDAKFPQDVYVQLQDAYEEGDPKKIEIAYKNLERTIKQMAKDINQKYLNPPFTTDFGIMFLPFEGIYAEVIRNGSLMESLQREYKIVVTGPTTLAAILNSLQMGFKTLAIQKRSSEVWQVLGAVKKEFEEFGGMLDKAQKNFRTGLNQLDQVRGVRTRAIERKLRDVESLDSISTSKIFPVLESNGIDEIEDLDDLEPNDVQQN